MITTHVHAWQLKGLGLAPFTFLRLERETPARCAFCNKPLSNCYWLRSSDAKEFIVGSDCIRREGDRGLIRIVEEHERAARQEKAKLDGAKAREFLQKVLSGKHAARLRAEPHPMPWLASQGKKKYDYIEYMLKHAGPSSLKKLARDLQKGGFKL